MPILSAQRIEKHFGGVAALRGASFSCEPGEIHALLGGNGAGKSTLVKILCGVLPPDGGEVAFKGEPVTFKGPAAAASAGIVPVFQELSLVPDLTVAENLFYGREPRTLGLIDSRKLRRATREHLASLGFPSIDPDASVRDLPLAERQLVEIAKAVARSPDVLILDEATSALGAREVDVVFTMVRELRARGMAIVFISHRMEEIQAICDRATIFRDGEDVGTVDVGTTRPDDIVRMMIGRSLTDVFPDRPPRPDQEQPLLEVRNLGWGTTLHDISLSVSAGEIVGLAGLDGQGQGDLLFALFGVYAGMSGSVSVRGCPVRLTSPAAAMRAGLAFIPEDRKTQGLLLPLSVRDNIALPVLARLSRLGVLSRQRERHETNRMIAVLSIKTASPDQPIRYLSGGNQQKGTIAKWLLTNPDTFLLYDPTRGIDVATKQEIYRLLRALAAQGKGMLLFSSDLTEIIGLCDRALVMYEGRIFREFHGAQITKENLVHASLGLRAEDPVPVAV
ncbi:MAG: sugar ABC transporter ATP-binding protein [Propionibacteriaceae bacterium]|nr:sugar ABC transporter ATP-binding protein [Propionibacteriaceae bacterium]